MRKYHAGRYIPYSIFGNSPVSCEHIEGIKRDMVKDFDKRIFTIDYSVTEEPENCRVKVDCVITTLH